MLFKKTLLAATVFALGGIAFTASAATNPATASFQVKLTINKACTVSTSGALDFGNADANSTSNITQSASNINVTCSKKTAYTVGLTPTSNAIDGTGTMKGATSGNTDTIAYALYQDSGDTTAWGTGANTLTATNGLVVGNGLAQNYPVYGKVLGTSLNVQPDAYADTVTVSVAY